MEKKNLNEVFSDFIEFLRAHAKPVCPCDNDDDDSMENKEIAEMAAKQAKLFCDIRPKAVDIFMDKEHEFVDAIRQLVDKHKSLETVEQIEKLTKDILKICK